MPEAAVATAPPPAAPSPNAAPAAAPPPPVTERAPSEFMGDIEADFGDMDAGKPVRERDETGKFRPVAKEKPATAPEKAPEKPVEKPAEDVPPEKAPEKPAEAPKPTRMRELGQAYDDLKKRVNTEYEPTIQKLSAKVKELETRQPEDTGPVLQKLKTLEERNAALEKHMALVDYEQSNEFSTKYDQPYREMWDRATNAFSQLNVREPAGEDDVGNPKFNTRRATESDLIKLGALPLSELDEAAHTMFGASAPRAVQYIERLRDLSESKQKALVEAKNKAGEWKSQRSLEFQNRQKTLANAWSDINRGLEKKFPLAFNVTEGDADDAASHAKGFALADLLFLGNQALTPQQIDALPSGFRDTLKEGKPLTEVQKVQLHALARLKMANHDRKVSQLKKATARIAELEKSLADYEKSEPAADKAGDGGTVAAKSFEDQVSEDMEKLDRR